MSTSIDDAFEDYDSGAADLKSRVERLQRIVCQLLAVNEELRAAVREAELLRLQVRAARDKYTLQSFPTLEWPSGADLGSKR